MKTLSRIIGGALLTMFVAFGMYAATTVSAQAQYPQYPNGQNPDWRRDRDRDRDRDRGNGRYGNVTRIAEDRGYQDGLSTGANDAANGQSYNPGRSHYYKNATYGYDSSHGNKNAYKQAYRDGFTRGYEQGYQRNRGGNRGGYNNRRGNWGRWFPYR